MKFSRNILPVIILVVSIICIIAIYSNHPSKERNLKETQYTGIAFATVKSVRVYSNLKFTEAGNEFFISHRVVDYTFTVDGNLYSGQDIVPARLRYKKINIRLNPGKSVCVKYDKNNPSNNIITRKLRDLE